MINILEYKIHLRSTNSYGTSYMSLRMKTHKVKRKTDTGGFCIRAQDDVPVHTVHPSTQTEQFFTLSNAQFL